MEAGAARVPSRFHGSECLSKVGERFHSTRREKAACCEAADDISYNLNNTGSHLCSAVCFHTHLYDVFTVNAEEN